MTRLASARRQDKIRQDKTRQDRAGQDKQDKTKKDKTRPDKGTLRYEKTFGLAGLSSSQGPSEMYFENIRYKDETSQDQDQDQDQQN